VAGARRCRATRHEEEADRDVSALPQDVEISTDPARLDVDLIHGFLQETYWAQGRPRSVVERSIRNSLCFGAFVGDRQVGFARVVSDKAVFGYLADVFVLPEYRGRGIAKALMRSILAHPDLQNLRTFLLGTRDAHGLYSRFGFRPLPEPERMMIIHNPDAPRDLPP
jgi:GNAT superfamily N-acetyltransferase